MPDIENARGSGADSARGPRTAADFAVRALRLGRETIAESPRSEQKTRDHQYNDQIEPHAARTTSPPPGPRGL